MRKKKQKPQHILDIAAKKVELDGAMHGGDALGIHGKRNADGSVEKCDTLMIGEGADIDQKNASIKAKEGDISGAAAFENSYLEIDNEHIGEAGKLALKASLNVGEVLTSDGGLTTENTLVEYKKAEFSEKAHETLKDKSFLEFEKLSDKSQMEYEKYASITADMYEHSGHVKKIGDEKNDCFSVKAKQAELSGSSGINNGVYDIEKFKDGEKFFSGKGHYAKYEFKTGLDYKTKEEISINKINRECDLDLEASKIDWNATLSNKHTLRLKSTKKNITITNDLDVKDLWVDSNKDIKINSKVNGQEIMQMISGGVLYNLGGSLTGKTVQLKASDIFNITRDSEKAKQDFGIKIGNSGVINASKDALLEATTGNIENHGGMIRGGEYAQLIAKKDILNMCNIKERQGRYDVIKEFVPGLITGGKGSAETNEVGLLVKAGGKVIADASDFIAAGSVNLSGKQGVEFKACSHTYVAKDEWEKKWYGKKKHIVETKTDVQGCHVQSGTGRNIIKSEEGGVTGTAVDFVSPGGTDILAKKEVKLYSLKTKDHRYVSKSNLWGLSKSMQDEWHENSVVSMILDNGQSLIRSYDENVDLSGAYIVGKGDIDIEAKKKIIFSRDILNHRVKTKTEGFGVSAFGMGAYNALKNGGSLWDALSSEDATLAKINSLYDCQNALELIAASSNLGINLFNTTNSIMRGVAENQLDRELLTRYGLGGSEGFNPRIGLSFTKTKTDSSYQTLGVGGVDRGGNARYKAGEGIALNNGVRVHNDGDTEVDAPTVEANAAELKSSYRHEEKKVTLGLTASGEVVDAGVEYTRDKSESTDYENSELSSGGKMKVHNNGEAVDHVALNGANVNAKSIDAKIKELIVEDKISKSKLKSDSGSASTSGAVSFATSRSQSAEVKQRSGIHSDESINEEGNTLEIDNLHMKGGAITSNGVNNAKIGELQAEAIEEYRRSSGFGISGNPVDMGQKAFGSPNQQPGSQAIATCDVNVNHGDYEATSTSVIYGAKGTKPSIGKQTGEVHTKSADGRQVKKDTRVNVALVIPITNKEHLAQAGRNVQKGVEKIERAFSKPDPKVMLDPVVAESKDGFMPPETFKDCWNLAKGTYEDTLPELDNLTYLESLTYHSDKFGDYKIIATQSADGGLVFGIEGTSSALNWVYNLTTLPAKEAVEFIVEKNIPKEVLAVLPAAVMAQQKFLEGINEKIVECSKKYNCPVAGFVGHSAGASISDSLIKNYHQDAHGVLFNGYQTRNSEHVVNVRAAADPLSGLASNVNNYTTIVDGGGHSIETFEPVAESSWEELKDSAKQIGYKREEEALSVWFDLDEHKAERAALEQLRKQRQSSQHTPAFFKSGQENKANDVVESAKASPH